MDNIDKARGTQLATQAWAKATANQKAGVRFGMTDVELFRIVGLDPYGKDPVVREFTLALMDCAKQDGGMRV